MSTSKGTKVVLGQSAEEVELSGLLSDYVRLMAEVKKTTALAEVIAGGPLKRWVERKWLDLYGVRDDRVPTPFKFFAHDGSSVTWVVQDKTKSVIEPGQVEDLQSLLGSGTVSSLLTEETFVALDPSLAGEMSRRRGLNVGEVLSDRLLKLKRELVADFWITQEQADRLFVFYRKRRLKAGFLNVLPTLARDSRVRIVDVLGVLGSMVPRFLQS